MIIKYFQLPSPNLQNMIIIYKFEKNLYYEKQIGDL